MSCFEFTWSLKNYNSYKMEGLDLVVMLKHDE